MYCLMIPFLSSGCGSSHDKCTEVELNTVTAKSVGGPEGTVVVSYDFGYDHALE